eukprot:SAG31_NODE_2989_length_4813_cov_8.205346_2_plen_71_part_00
MADREVQFFLQLCYSFDIDCLVRSPSTVERTKLYRYFEDGATGVMIVSSVQSSDCPCALIGGGASWCGER